MPVGLLKINWPAHDNYSIAVDYSIWVGGNAIGGKTDGKGRYFLILRFMRAIPVPHRNKPYRGKARQRQCQRVEETLGMREST